MQMSAAAAAVADRSPAPDIALIDDAWTLLVRATRARVVRLVRAVRPPPPLTRFAYPGTCLGGHKPGQRCKAAHVHASDSEDAPEVRAESPRAEWRAYSRYGVDEPEAMHRSGSGAGRYTWADTMPIRDGAPPSGVARGRTDPPRWIDLAAEIADELRVSRLPLRTCGCLDPNSRVPPSKRQCVCGACPESFSADVEKKKEKSAATRERATPQSRQRAEQLAENDVAQWVPRGARQPHTADQTAAAAEIVALRERTYASRDQLERAAIREARLYLGLVPGFSFEVAPPWLHRRAMVADADTERDVRAVLRRLARASRESKPRAIKHSVDRLLITARATTPGPPAAPSLVAAMLAPHARAIVEGSARDLAALAELIESLPAPHEPAGGATTIGVWTQCARLLHGAWLGAWPERKVLARIATLCGWASSSPTATTIDELHRATLDTIDHARSDNAIKLWALSIFYRRASSAILARSRANFEVGLQRSAARGALGIGGDDGYTQSAMGE